MAKKSLTDLLGDDEFDITLSQEGLATTLHINQVRGVRTISAHGITLAYDLERFQEDPAVYVAEQLRTHQEYHKLVRGELSGAYRDLHDLLDKESDVEGIFRLLPEDATRSAIEVAKLAIAPTYWARFRTLRGALKESVQSVNLEMMGYALIEAMINYGKRFVDERLSQSAGKLPNTVTADVAEWKTVQGELSYLYSKIVAAGRKKVQVGQRLYQLLFPNSADIIE